MSHNFTHIPGEAWEEADAESVGSAYKLRKQNRQRSRQQDAWQRLSDEDEDERKEARQRPAARRQRPNQPEEFRCRHCRAMIGPVPSGGRHRNHCPLCLHSRHVDERMPGDRLSSCGATMAPIGFFTHPNGEYGLVHQCMACGIKRHNRIAADDDFDLVLALPDLTQQMPGEQSAIVEAEGDF